MIHTVTTVSWFVLALSPAGLVTDVEARSPPAPEAQGSVLELDYSTSLFRGRDALASPMAYQGLIAGGSISLERRDRSSWRWFYLAGGMGRPKPLFAPDAEVASQSLISGSLLVDANLRYGYDHVIARSSNDRFGLYAGGVLGAGFHFLRPNGQTDAYFRLTSWSLNAGALARYRVASRHLVTGQLFAPFLAQVGRSPWSLRDPKLSPSLLFQGDLTSLNGYRSITARIHYEYALSRRWNGAVSCEITYVNSPSPEPIDILNSSLFVGLSLSM